MPVKGADGCRSVGRGGATNTHTVLDSWWRAAADGGGEPMEELPSMEELQQSITLSQPDVDSTAGGEDAGFINKDKIAEVRKWLSSWEGITTKRENGRVLVLSGPPGCGKATLVRALAHECGYELLEWEAPVPMLFTELTQEVPYESKLAAFSSFLRDATTRPVLGAQRVAVFVDDLPEVGGGRRERGDRLEVLVEAFMTAAESSIVPVVVAVGGAKGKRKGVRASIEYVQEALEAVGAPHVVLNPVIGREIGKALTRVAASRGLQMTDVQKKEIMGAAGGDLRYAVNLLPLYLAGQARVAGAGAAKSKKRKVSERTTDGGGGASTSGNSSRMGKDNSLVLFHGIGKILYSKREAEWNDDDSWMDQSYRRRIQKSRAEDVLATAHLDFTSLSGFVFENYPDFVAAEDIADAAEIADAIALADTMRPSYRMRWAKGEEGDLDADLVPVTEASATLACARGVMYALQAPSAHGYRPLRGPGDGKRLAQSRKNAMQAEQAIAMDLGVVSARGGLRVLREALVPFCRRLASLGYRGWTDESRMMYDLDDILSL